MAGILDKFIEGLFYFVFACVFVFIGFLVGNVITVDDVLKVKEEIKNYSGEEFYEGLTVWHDQPEKVHDKHILLSVYTKKDTPSILVDSKGNILNKWKFDFESHLDSDEFKKDSKFLTGEEMPDSNLPFRFTESHMYPNGDLLGIAIITTIFTHGMYDYGVLVMLDKDSNILWSKYGKYNHEAEMLKDGSVNVLESKLIDDFKGFNYTKEGSEVAFIDTIINTFERDGTISRKFSVYESFMKSEFRHYINVLSFASKFTTHDGKEIYDPFHVNDSFTITKDVGWPFAEKDDILISLRNQDLVALIRPSEEKVVWARRGPWKSQHNLQVTDDGFIRLFDNDGNFIVYTDHEENKVVSSNRSRVIEYNPVTDDINLIYKDVEDRSLYSSFRSGHFELDGEMGYIIQSGHSGRVIQVDNEGEIIWELRGLSDRDKNDLSNYSVMKSMQVYGNDYAEFLNNNKIKE